MRLQPAALEHGADAVRLPISPLEGEMSPKATEGVAARGAPTPPTAHTRPSPVEPTPSGLPAISPSRGEIGCRVRLRLSSAGRRKRGLRSRTGERCNEAANGGEVGI
ncbi:hypothetical protein FKO01_26950 [Mesorhizobium sp. B2-3-3]|nr:hypothetical protein FKO01_26950 [Mesorhizobium sp. B2-3-3]